MLPILALVVSMARKRMGQALAKELLEPAARHADDQFRSLFGTIGLEVSLPSFNVRVTDNLRLRPWLASTLIHHSDRTILQAFRFDNAMWISTPCDFSGELALGIKDFLRGPGDLKPRINELQRRLRGVTSSLHVIIISMVTNPG